MAADPHNPLNSPPAHVAETSSDTDGPQDEMFAAFLADADLAPANEHEAAEAEEAPPAEKPPLRLVPTPPAVPPSPPQPPAALPPPVRFSYNGNFYTLEELAQQGLLTEALQKASQFDTQKASAAAPVEAPQPTPTPLSAKELHRQMSPMVEELVTQGFIEADLPELYPQMTASMVSLYQQVGALRQAMQSIVQFYGQQQQQSQTQQVTSMLDNAIAATMQRGGLYQSLTDDTTQEGFRKYLWDLNPMVSQLTPEFVARQYVSYVASDNTVLQKLQHQLAAQRQGASGAPVPVAVPARGSTRQPRQPVPNDEAEPWADMMEGLL